MNNSQKLTLNTYTSLMIQCDEAGISLAKACRLANVDYSGVRRWKTKEPKTLTTLQQLQLVIRQHKNEKS